MGVAQNEDYSILESILGSPFFRKLPPPFLGNCHVSGVPHIEAKNALGHELTCFLLFLPISHEL